MITVQDLELRAGARLLMDQVSFRIDKGDNVYVSPNLKSKKALREALATGKPVSIFSPGPFPAPEDGVATVEGPHYPEPHRWYARVKVEGGRVVKVLG